MASLVTQPYDKISPEMQARYLAASPYNLVRVILGEHRPSDNDADNVYTRASKYLRDWIQEGILEQDRAPAFYAYFQEFEVPDSSEVLMRKGFIGLGRLEDYSAGVVYRHEQTLSGPKRDRLELLRHTRAHFGQIFMLYPDPESAVEQLLYDTSASRPALDVLDEYRVRHRAWAIADESRIRRIRELMSSKKLLIADGHHRYETALAFRGENPGVPAARYAMMTFVNLDSPGLKILATHRVLRNVAGFNAVHFFEQAVARGWSVAACETLEGLKRRMASNDSKIVQIGVVAKGDWRLLHRPRKEGEMDVAVLHRQVLSELLGIGEEAVRDEKHIQYVRGIDPAAAEVDRNGAQAAFLLEPTPIEDVARIAFGGGVMPQKSTDFYPKLLSGATIYCL